MLLVVDILVHGGSPLCMPSWTGSFLCHKFSVDSCHAILLTQQAEKVKIAKHEGLETLLTSV
ncbi:MAG: hypothetical protein MK165_11285 [Pirellulaceae bacterium]|nr:hypothetical protein [Pirellulaceae bacterium]